MAELPTETRASIKQTVTLALQEDVGSGDITADLIPADGRSVAHLVCREQAILCGTAWFDEVFQQLDPATAIEWSANDGDRLQPDQVVCIIKGNSRSMLTAERTAMNLLQTLSGTATITARYVELLGETRTRILDTRKTIPGLRLAQKYAVLCGGGHNHRVGLYDAVLIKENHIVAAGSIREAVEQARQLHPDKLLEVEVENLDELKEALDADVHRVLLDNMNDEQIREAVSVNNNRAELEISGGVDKTTINRLGRLGVDYISIGALTKHVHAVDFSLRFEHDRY